MSLEERLVAERNRRLKDTSLFPILRATKAMAHWLTHLWMLDWVNSSLELILATTKRSIRHCEELYQRQSIYFIVYGHLSRNMHILRETVSTIRNCTSFASHVRCIFIFHKVYRQTLFQLDKTESSSLSQSLLPIFFLQQRGWQDCLFSWQSFN